MESAAAIKDLKVQVTNKQILQIALPITIAILIPQVNMLTNSIFLGNLSLEALGNAGITGVFYLIFAVAGFGLNNAVQAVFSRSAGSNDPAAFKIIFSQGIRIALQFAFAGILITWLIAPFILQAVADPKAYPLEMSFLRIRIFGLPFLFLFQIGNAFLVASLNSRYIIFGFVAEALINILFDYLLIFGHAGFPKMGFNGAAVASVIAEISGCLLVFIVLIKTGLKQEYGLLKNLKYDFTKSKQILKIATPLVLQFMISIITWLTFFILIESRHDEKAKAISNTMRNVFGLAGVFAWAFSGTCNAMVSNLMGQQKQDKVLEAVKKITMWSFGCCFILCLLINIFPHAFFSLFGQGEAFIEQGIPVLRMVTIGMLFMCLAIIWLNAVTGTGFTKINLGIEIIAISFYLMYTWYFMKLNYISLTVAWSNELVYWSLIFLLSYLFMKSGKWKRG